MVAIFSFKPLSGRQNGSQNVMLRAHRNAPASTLSVSSFQKGLRKATILAEVSSIQWCSLSDAGLSFQVNRSKMALGMMTKIMPLWLGAHALRGLEVQEASRTWTHRTRERERYKQTERQRQTERRTDRQTDEQADRQTEIEHTRAVEIRG